MKLLKLRVDGFGPLRGEWAFAPDRTNLVVEENERGKSSMLAAIHAALYGLDDDRRTHRVITPRERWKPWNGGAYRVTLELEVGHQRYAITRDFDAGTVAVFDGSGREVTAEFADGKDEFPVGRKLLGVDADEFEKCALLRQGELDQVVPGDEKARRASTLKARLENAADTHFGDTNASEALKVLDDALRRYTAAELEFTGTVDNAIDRLEAKRGVVETQLKELEYELLMAQPQLDDLGRLADDELAMQERLRALEAERRAGLAADVRRQLAAHEAALAEVARLEAEVREYAPASRLPANADGELTRTVAEYEAAMRNLETLDTRRREEVARDKATLDSEMAGLAAYADYAAPEADRCVALAAELRASALDDAKLRREVFELRDVLASRGYEPERIQFLTARFGSLPEGHQRLLRGQAEVNLAFQTEVAGLEQQRTTATESLRGIDAARSARRAPGLFLLALGLGAALAGAVVLGLHGVAVLAIALLGAGGVVALTGAIMLMVGARSQGGDRDGALRELAEAQRRISELRTKRAENQVGLAELARLMGYRDEVELLRHWNEYARLVEDSGPLMRAQEQLAQSETRRHALHEQAKPLLRALGEVAPTPDLLEKVAYDARRAVAARDRLASLNQSFGWVEEEKRVAEAAATGLKERAIRQLREAGLVYDPEKSWAEHVAMLRKRVLERDRHRMVEDELLPRARRDVLPDVEVEQRRRQLEMLGAGNESRSDARSSAEIEVEARQISTKREEARKLREDLRVQVEEVWRRQAQKRPELEAERDRLARASERARRFKRSVEIARATLEQVATDTHRKWADFLNERVAEILRAFGTRVDALRFGDDLDFSVQLDGGPLVSRGKAHLQLSAGARDQLYLAVRLAVSEFLSRGSEPLPLLVDDAFATSDDLRLQAGMRALIEGLGGGHQVILVTCHRGRYQDLRRLDPELYRERVHWLDLRANATTQS